MIRFTLPDKTPRTEDTFAIDWAEFLGEDTLTGTPTASVVEGSLVVDDLVHDSTTTTKFWVRGGELGEVCRACVQVQTVGGRELDAEILLGIR